MSIVKVVPTAPIRAIHSRVNTLQRLLHSIGCGDVVVLPCSGCALPLADFRKRFTPEIAIVGLASFHSNCCNPMRIAEVDLQAPQFPVKATGSTHMSSRRSIGFTGSEIVRFILRVK